MFGKAIYCVWHFDIFERPSAHTPQKPGQWHRCRLLTCHWVSLHIWLEVPSTWQSGHCAEYIPVVAQTRPSRFLRGHCVLVRLTGGVLRLHPALRGRLLIGAAKQWISWSSLTNRICHHSNNLSWDSPVIEFSYMCWHFLSCGVNYEWFFRLQVWTRSEPAGSAGPASGSRGTNLSFGVQLHTEITLDQDFNIKQKKINQDITKWLYHYRLSPVFRVFIEKKENCCASYFVPLEISRREKSQGPS